MSFEPTKVIEMKDGKQVGQTMTQHAENIPYGNTTVGAELTKINTDLSVLNTYVSQEVDTGKVWFDGKHIYRKCFSGASLSTGTNILDAQLKNVSLISCIGTVYDAYGTSIILPYSGNQYGVLPQVMAATGFEVYVTGFTTVSNYSFAIEYTKNN